MNTVSQGAGAMRRVHSPRDMGKRNAEKRAAGACDLGDSLTTTGVFCLCTRSHSNACSGHSVLDKSLSRVEGTITGTRTETITVSLHNLRLIRLNTLGLF